MKIYVSREHREKWKTAKEMAEEAILAIAQNYLVSCRGRITFPWVISAEYIPPPRSEEMGILCVHFVAVEHFLDWLAIGMATPTASSPSQEKTELEEWQAVRVVLKQCPLTADYWSYQMIFLHKPPYWTSMLMRLPTVGGGSICAGLYIALYAWVLFDMSRINYYVLSLLVGFPVVSATLLMSAELGIRKYRMRKHVRDIWSNKLRLPPPDQSFEDYLGLSPALAAKLEEQSTPVEKEE
jgi:hypothetical protein